MSAARLAAIALAVGVVSILGCGGTKLDRAKAAKLLEADAHVRHVDRVTGITFAPGATTAEVDYLYTLKGVTAGAQRARLRLYDDGWRVEVPKELLDANAVRDISTAVEHGVSAPVAVRAAGGEWSETKGGEK